MQLLYAAQQRPAKRGVVEFRCFVLVRQRRLWEGLQGSGWQWPASDCGGQLGSILPLHYPPVNYNSE